MNEGQDALNLENKKELKVYMLGKFRVTGLDGELGIEHKCPKRIIKLMAYIFSHHKENLPILKISDALYTDEEIANPIAATRNLIWRLRAVFKEEWGELGNTFLVTKGSDYRWNEEISLSLDTEQMETLSIEAETAKTGEIKIEKYMQAAALYAGSYMEGYDDVYWAAYPSARYHTMYLQIVKKLAVLLEQHGRYEEMQRVMETALNREQLDEELYVYFIRALMKQGYMGMALEEYKKSTAFLYENLGYTSMDQLRELYDELMEQMHEEQSDIQNIRDDLRTDSQKGAFLCEYGVFKKIYQLEVRRAERIGMSVFLSLISIRIRTSRENLAEEKRAKLLVRSMKKMQEILLSSLRSGDVVARCSGNQYMILLPTCQYETAKKVMERIEDAFYRHNRERYISVEYYLEGLD
ncbi:BTAD domain-containing putative transcriptional regulator [Frisingicoccus sp.]|uniref:BTAD domain-containing putative transcriptional regulator n=1 Tax=Frisingicoccus sp. TaxID=1918627 RepID=UPI003AB571AB